MWMAFSSAAKARSYLQNALAHFFDVETETQEKDLSQHPTSETRYDISITHSPPPPPRHLRVLLPASRRGSTWRCTRGLVRSRTRGRLNKRMGKHEGEAKLSTMAPPGLPRTVSYGSSYEFLVGWTLACRSHHRRMCVREEKGGGRDAYHELQPPTV